MILLTYHQVHHVCDAGAGPCIDMIDRMNAQVSLSAGMPPTAQPRLPKLPGQGEFPLAGSCGKCNHEETGRMNMNRCSGCKLIRSVALEYFIVGPHNIRTRSDIAGEVICRIIQMLIISRPVWIARGKTGRGTKRFANLSKTSNGSGIDEFMLHRILCNRVFYLPLLHVLDQFLRNLIYLWTLVVQKLLYIRKESRPWMGRRFSQFESLEATNNLLHQQVCIYLCFDLKTPSRSRSASGLGSLVGNRLLCD